MLKSDTKFYGGDHKRFVWATGKRLDAGGHKNKRGAIYEFKAGETYRLLVSGRSQKFKLDRIVFRHESIKAKVAEDVTLPESNRNSPSNRTRLVVMADMGNEHDEMQQMIHMTMCSNEFEPKLLIAVTGKYLQPGLKNEYRCVTHPELFHEIIDAYEKVYSDLQKHASGWHPPDYLRSIVCVGQPEYGVAGVGEGKSSDGSRRLVELFEEEDDRPIWIVVNAGSNTLAQALRDFAESHKNKEVRTVISKLRVFENGAQDNAGAYICNRYPNIHWIRSNYQTYCYGGPGRVRDLDAETIGPHFWGDHANSPNGQNDWLHQHVIDNHGALGEVYPERRFAKRIGYMEGGGTIPWIGLANRGLYDIDHPSWGGWGGRFTRDKVANVWSRHQSVRVDDEKHVPFQMHTDAEDSWHDAKHNTTHKNTFSPVWRWREAMYNDFQCRMDWCVKSFEEANHHPRAVFNGDSSDEIVSLTALPGKRIELSAVGSSDPDNDGLSYSWWFYPEASDYEGAIEIESSKELKAALVIPEDAARKKIHVILEVKDNSEIVSLFDYRRIVINVSNRKNQNRKQTP